MVAEYLRGGVTLRELERRHGVSFSTIHRWVKAHERGEAGKVSPREMVEMPKDIRKLQRELHEARLEAKLYKTMIEIAEKEMGIPIRKKSGAK